MNSKLRDILGQYGNALIDKCEQAAFKPKTIKADDVYKFVEENMDEAEKAIRQAVGEEMLGLKPNNPYKTTDGQVPESFEAPAHAYDVANGDWEQKIKEWSQS